MALSKYIKQPMASNLQRYTDTELRKIEATLATFFQAIEELNDMSIETGSFVLTSNGFATEISVTAKYIKINNRFVFIELPSVSGTSDSTVFELLGLPTTLYPGYDTPLTVALIVNNSVAAFGYAGVGADNIIRMAPSAGGAFSGWTNSGAKSLIRTTLGYIL